MATFKEQIAQEVIEARKQWQDDFANGSIADGVMCILDNSVKYMILTHLGVDRGWSGNWRVDRSINGDRNPFYDQIASIARGFAQRVVERLGTTGEIFKLTDEENRELDKAARLLYAEQFRMEVLQLVKEKATADAEAFVETLVLDTVVEEVAAAKPKAARKAKPAVIDFNTAK
jgi:hypothetical protein